MKKEFFLYLDESEDEQNLFCMAGVIVSKENLLNFENEMHQAKRMLWEESYIKKYHPVLHSNELNFVKKNASNSERSRFCKGAYHNFAKHTTEEINRAYIKLYQKLTQSIKNNSITTIGCAILKNQMQNLYPFHEKSNGYHLVSDYYDIAFQVLMENFCHFLIQTDGVGYIIYEARSYGQSSENSADVRMLDNFHKIMACGKGIGLLNENAMRKHIRNLKMIDKQYNYAGLQLADFVAFNYLKMIQLKHEEDRTGFMNQIFRYAYNGGFCRMYMDVRYYYGIRYVPFSMERILALQEQNQKLSLRIENLKRERERLQKRLDRIQKTQK